MKHNQIADGALLGERLGYRGRFAGQSARKWAMRRGLPKYWRGRCWVVRMADVDAALEGKDFHA